MAVQTITYDDKSYLNQNSDIADANKVNDSDMNEIKTVVNNNANILSGVTTYSTTETDTGKTWIDGKTIYSKVIDLGIIGSQTSISMGSGYDTITNFSGYMYKDDGSKSSIIEYDDSQMWKVFSFTVSSSGVGNVLSNRASLGQWSDWKLKVIIEYTKTS